MLSPLEQRRQLLHTATLLIPLLYWFFPDIGSLTGQQWVLLMFVVFGGLFVFADYFRRYNSFIKRVFLWLVSPFIRDVEEDRMTNASHIGITFFLVLLIFPKNISVPACMLLSVADSASGIVGRMWGKRTWYKNYTYAGTFAFIVAGFLLYLFAFPYITVWKAALVVVMCALFEGLMSHYDDNVVIPIAAAVMLMMLEV